MTSDQAQSPRLGQRVPIESTYVQIFDTIPDNKFDDLVEAAWPGMLIFRNDIGILQIYNGEQKAWQDVAGGTNGMLTYVGTEEPVKVPPDTFHIGDAWYDSDAGMTKHVWDGDSWVAVSTTAGIMTYYATGFVPNPDFDPGQDESDTNPSLLWEPLAGTFNIGDIWYQTDDFNHQYRWDGGEWVNIQDGDTQIALDQSGINFGEIENLTVRVDELDQLASSANNTADTADGRVSMSDYHPGNDDLTYLQEIVNTETGMSTFTEVERENGSIWFTRTRPRRNLCTNPSFEVNTTDWTAYECAMVRFPMSGVPAGEYTLEVTNTATAGDHYVQWSPPVRQSCESGRSYAASIFAELVSGSGVGAFIEVVWYDTAGVELSTSVCPPFDLIVNAWDPVLAGTIAEPRLWLTDAAPLDADSFVVRVHNTNPGDVWHTGACLIEQEDDLGRYFDGESYDGHWDADTHNSPSYLEGDKIIEIWELRDGSWIRKYLTSATIQALEGWKLTGEVDGQLLGDNTVPTTAMATALVQTSEALLAGDLVHIWNDDGVFKARKASASARYDAHGFVWEDCAVDGIIRVYHVGYNPWVKNLAPGGQWLSPVAGKVTNQPPASVGQLVQRVGYAPAPTVLNFSPSTPIRIT